jgi:hypothetical protein
MACPLPWPFMYSVIIGVASDGRRDQHLELVTGELTLLQRYRYDFLGRNPQSTCPSSLEIMTAIRGPCWRT